MSTITQTSAILLVLAGMAGLLLGYAAGCKSARKQRRKLQHELNQQSLQFLDVKSDLSKLEKHRDQFDRKDRLLKLSLKKLADVNAQTRQFEKKIEAKDRAHFVVASRLEVSAAEARQQAKRAAQAAKHVSRQLKKLEQLSLNTQTIHAPEPKSYGHGEAVKVSVVDQHTPNGTKETVARVSNKDSVRLSRLKSSNEGQRYSDSLQAINGISADLERTLNAAGIHRIEQLANISDRELIDLRLPNAQNQTVAARAHWKVGAKVLLEQRSNA